MLKKTIYPSEFKREAVKLALSSGQPIAKIANELGVKPNTLYTWVKCSMNTTVNTNKISAKNKPNHRYQELERENLQLKKELKRAEMERDILKKAAAYFASQEL